jgi:hypothetical protein
VVSRRRYSSSAETLFFDWVRNHRLSGSLLAVEDGAADPAGLVRARAALPVPQPAAHEVAARRSTADRADKAPGPARRLQRRTTLVLRSVALEEFDHRKASLKLNSVHRHGSPPGWMQPSSSLTSSLHEPAEESR